MRAFRGGFGLTSSSELGYMISEIIGSHHPGENFSRPYGVLKGPQILVTLLVCTLAY